MIKHLGDSNGWGSKTLWGPNAGKIEPTPPEYLEHKEKGGHTVKSETIGRCYTRYTCETCGISWNIDSSD